MGPLDATLRAARRAPLGAALAVATVAFTAWFIAAPLFAARYPPMTDFPFHAAHTAIFHGYGDPSLHFREQFQLYPFSVPYMSMYWIGSALMPVLPVVTAVKVAAAVMLALLPAGLAVLFYGMKKSPIFGALLGLSGVWCALTHWGFLNFVGAVGLFAMALGEALLVVDRPTVERRLALAVTLVAIFFTHIFRFPFTLCAVVGAGIVTYPATRRIRPLILPMVPSMALFVAWWIVRPKALEGDFSQLSLHLERVNEIPTQLVNGFAGPVERRLFGDLWVALLRVAAVAGALAAVAALRARGGGGDGGERASAWRLGTHLAVLACAVVFFGLYLVLPMQMGVWWYVYPREATAAAFVALGLFPDLPRGNLLRAALLAVIAVPLAHVGGLVVESYAQFDRATEDFDRIQREIPKAPKLLYLIFDHQGSVRSNTPFIHLPAYIQATHGGWLSFHFAVWGASPVLYRDAKQPGAVVPPPVPIRWEWTPQRFDVRRQGAFFDWFLVRDTRSPERVFQADASIVPVSHVGTWWLYRRR